MVQIATAAPPSQARTFDATVTTRESLRWLPAAAFNDTDVLVISVGKYFVDLRVFTSGPNAGQIDWSMGGVCLALPATGVQDESPVRFLNVIDQRLLALAAHPRLPPSCVNPEESAQDLSEPSPDDVVFTPLPSLPGSTSPRSLESGKMPNPASLDTETYVPFEEVWQELPLAPGSPVIFLETVGGDGVGKAYSARVGPWALGLMDDDGKYLAWRADLVDGQWKSVYNFGGSAATEQIPRVDMVESWEEGAVVEMNGRNWIVRAVGVSA
ncbi:hypothetical protein RQP46_011196 [Phenoliferia psychrophenolica]